jgi:hypothetical protein
MLLAQLGRSVVGTVQAGLGLVMQLALVGCGRAVDRAGGGAGVGAGRAEACAGRGVWLGAAARVAAAGVPVGVGVPVGPGAIVTTALAGWGTAGTGGGDDPVSVIATAPAAVIAATAARRTAIQGHSPHSPLRPVPVDPSPEASLPAFILCRTSRHLIRFTSGEWRLAVVGRAAA